MVTKIDMTVTINFGKTPDSVVDAAARELMRVKHEGNGRSQITLPLFYPSGAVVAVDVIAGASGYVVTDAGLGFREAEMFGGEHLFGRNAAPIAERFGIEAGRREFRSTANVDQLAGTIADVGAASSQLAHRLYERMVQRTEAEIAGQLYDKLVHVFGSPKVVAEATVTGASSHKWRVSALVKLDGRDMAFQAVSNHHSSVYSSATMFHDLALLDRRPLAVAVVRNRREMGEYVGILSQAANVIEADVPDDTIRRLAA